MFLSVTERSDIQLGGATHPYSLHLKSDVSSGTCTGHGRIKWVSMTPKFLFQRDRLHNSGYTKALHSRTTKEMYC